MQKVYTKIESIVGNVITVRAEGVRNQDLAEITTAQGTGYANVIKLDGDKVSLQVFKGGQGVSTGDSVRFLGVPMRVSFSDALLGRVFDGAGKPRDKGPELMENMIDIGGPSVNPSKRIMPNKMIRTGIPMIDVFNTLVESQKLPIFSVSGEPYNELLARIAMQADVDIIILGGMGLKYDDYLFFRSTLVPRRKWRSRWIRFLRTEATREISIPRSHHAMRRLSISKVQAPSRSSVSQRCLAMTSRTPFRTTRDTSPKDNITSATDASSRSDRSRVSSRTSTRIPVRTTVP